MIANRWINVGYNKWNRMCFNHVPWKLVYTVRFLTEQNSCSGLLVLMEYGLSRGQIRTWICVFCKSFLSVVSESIVWFF